MKRVKVKPSGQSCMAKNFTVSIARALGSCRRSRRIDASRDSGKKRKISESP